MTDSRPPCEWVGDRLDTVRSRWRVDPDEPMAGPPVDYSPPERRGEDTEVFRDRLRATRKALRPLQHVLYAQRRYSVLLVFQALDAGGKDGAIREVLKGLDPVGVRVASFKRPSRLELAHDYLWRTHHQLPARGCIVAFNRSHYEEVLAVRVNPDFLDLQYNGAAPPPEAVWPERFRAIREHERHLANCHTVVLKFWLNVSPQRQARRFLRRLEDSSRHWKFSRADLDQSEHREKYDAAITEAMNETTRRWAPWFCVPADDRWYLRWQIADILLQTLEALPLRYPEPEPMADGERKRLQAELRIRSGEESAG